MLGKFCPAGVCKPGTQAHCYWSMAVAVIVAGGICFYFNKYCDQKFPQAANMADRLALALRVLVFPALTLAAAIGRVSFGRCRSAAINPLAGRDHVIEFHQRILQNTLEQLAIHVVAILSLATYLTPDTFKFVPMLSGMFVLGRILFWLGYPNRRTFGYALGKIANVAAVWCGFYHAYQRGGLFQLGGAA